MTGQERPRPPASDEGTGPAANQTASSVHPQGVCPDCAALFADDHLYHAPTCPAGAGLAHLVADDRQWFKDHPHADYRIRPLHLAEVAHLRATSWLADDQAAAGQVCVARVPGLGLLALPLDIVLTPRGGRR